MGKHVHSISHKARQYIKKNPKATAREVADAVGCSIKVAYYARRTLRKNVTRKNNPAQLSLPLFMKRLRNAEEAAVKEVDMVNSPPHYTAGGVETIDFIEAKNLNYNLGNAVKYITRAGLKGSRVEDLQKAKWYIEREILASHI
jgi:hypothetical protein